MILSFKFGFKFNTILYGFNDKKLYRLPQMIGLRFYPLLELPQIKVGNKKGYLVGTKRKSLNQIKSMTHFIDEQVEIVEDSDCPF